MKKEYNKPEMEVISLNSEEIMATTPITVSAGNGGNYLGMDWDSDNWQQ